MTFATLMPAPERFVRDPATGEELAAGGEDKVLDAFWRRRIADGDVIDITPPPAAVQPAAAVEGSPSGRTEATSVPASSDAEAVARPRPSRKPLRTKL